jgi:hypothetical protein
MISKTNKPFHTFVLEKSVTYSFSSIITLQKPTKSETKRRSCLSAFLNLSELFLESPTQQEHHQLSRVSR